MLMVAAGVAVCLGGLVGAWAYSSVGSAQEVLALRTAVPRGSVVSEAALTRVRVGVDPALRPVPADQADSIVGKRAAVDLAVGGLVTVGSVTDEVPPKPGESVVGIALTATAMPALPLMAGDNVRIVATPGEQGDLARAPRVLEATVVDVHTLSDAASGTVVDVTVPQAWAAEWAARAATGKVALVLDSRER